MAGADTGKKWLINDRLLQSQKLAALGELSASIAHEINNPLAIIRQEAELMSLILKNASPSTTSDLGDLQESIRMIVQQVDRCSEIIRNLLDFARRREPVVQAVELNRVVEDMTRLVEKEARNNHITIKRRYDPELPLIYCDAPELRQVVLNILSNAAQAIGKNGTITIITRRAGRNAVELVIEDTGCGIPEENLEKIFEPFFSTKPPGQGTGLGLSISHGLIEQLGGSIRVRSAVGQGTSFTITLPLRPLAGDSER
ncbi:MAG: ATP-binding protein [Deltaproteobacteria bacterium]|nr:ATP-binding protein [Deltaproteobacteria bacterium]